MIAAAVIYRAHSDAYMKSKSTIGCFRPEHRLLPMVLGSILVPLGLIGFGWTAQG